MPKYAYFDHTATQPTRVLGWYDTDLLKYPNLPPAESLLELTQEQWNNRLSYPYLNEGHLVITPPPSDEETLANAKAAKTIALRDACTTQIISGYSSMALGTVHSYPSTVLDQQNMIASVTASLLPNLPADWTTPFWCEVNQGNWAFVEHTAAQIQKAGADGKAAIVAAQQKLADLTADLANAATLTDVAAISW